jgi:hypothetical protein
VRFDQVFDVDVLADKLLHFRHSEPIGNLEVKVVSLKFHSNEAWMSRS